MTTATLTNPSSTKRSSRLVSLDVLRGLTVALMILVNNAGDGSVSFSQLRHSVWNGCTLTDLVFPNFLFIVGASTALAFGARLKRGASKQEILLQVLKRAALIFLIGLFINALPFFALGELRIYGVLQRIALCYAIAAALYLTGRVLACAIAVPVLLLGYWFLMTHVVVPGYGMPGIDVNILDRAGNLAAWLDRTLVPAAHLYHHTNYDPEGLLGTLPAIATTLLGLLSTSYLQAAPVTAKRSFWLGAAGVLMMILGLFWDESFPINKRMWSSSYVLFAGGISIVLYVGLHWLIDGPKQMRKGLTPWLIFGSNALAAYIFSEVLAIALGAIPFPGFKNLQRAIYSLLPAWIGPAPVVSVIYSVLFVVACFLPMLWLYRRKIFFKL